jgi:phosphoglycolate phosphatase
VTPDPARDRLAGIELVILDKDGTLIEFHAMWSRWALDLADGLAVATGRDDREALFAMLGYDATTRRATGHGRLAATPMARLRDHTRDLLIAEGLTPADADEGLARAWHAPDPVALARPVTGLPPLLDQLVESGRRLAIATTDDREPTERTLEALGVAGRFDAVVCADDGIAPKPAPDMLLAVCTALDVDPSRSAMVGDSVADLQMGRAAGAGRCYGVLTGVGSAATLGPFADEVLASIAELVVPRP